MSDPRKFKSDIIVESGSISLPSKTASRALVIGSDGKLTSSTVTDSQLAALPSSVASAQADATQALTNAATAQSTANGAQTDATQALTNAAAASSAASSEASRAQAAETALGARIDALPAPLTYKGTYNATTNSPALANTDTGKAGFLYQVTVAGTQNLGAGLISFSVGDKVVNDGTIWDKWDLTDAVTSVNSLTGAVVFRANNINRADDSATIEASLTSLSSSVSSAQADATQALSNTAAETSRATAAEASLQTQINARPTAAAGDINETLFSLANNQTIAANVTGLAFAAATVRSFSALVSVEIDATADLYEQFNLSGINKGGTFAMSVDSVGDNSAVVFSITSTGQVQYTSTSTAGFVTGKIKFRAITTSV